MSTVATIAKSFKYSAHSNKNPAAFDKFVPKLIKQVQNSDLAVKKASLEALCEISFKSQLCQLLANYVNDLIQICLAETEIKKELISQVDLGPFKYTVDNGAPIRKAAFNLLQVMTDKFYYNQSAVVDATIAGFVDSNEDVQFVSLSFMINLIATCPVIVLNKLDQVVDRMREVYNKNAPQLKKQDAQIERSANLIRGILRVTNQIQRNPESESNSNFQSWIAQNVLNNDELPQIRQMYEKIAGNSQHIAI
mmetsp:Transcript_14247/g.24232  ORF Transcript_14247/g.24232 Transcript_14247/m.24232 type:complete len:251 (-) Transcript_14247:48-800(-)